MSSSIKNRTMPKSKSKSKRHENPYEFEFESCSEQRSYSSAFSSSSSNGTDDSLTEMLAQGNKRNAEAVKRKKATERARTLEKLMDKGTFESGDSSSESSESGSESEVTPKNKKNNSSKNKANQESSLSESESESSLESEEDSQKKLQQLLESSPSSSSPDDAPKKKTKRVQSASSEEERSEEEEEVTKNTKKKAAATSDSSSEDESGSESGSESDESSVDSLLNELHEKAKHFEAAKKKAERERVLKRLMNDESSSADGSDDNSSESDSSSEEEKKPNVKAKTIQPDDTLLYSGIIVLPDPNAYSKMKEQDKRQDWNASDSLTIDILPSKEDSKDSKKMFANGHNDLWACGEKTFGDFGLTVEQSNDNVSLDSFEKSMEESNQKVTKEKDNTSSEDSYEKQLEDSWNRAAIDTSNLFDDADQDEADQDEDENKESCSSEDEPKANSNRKSGDSSSDDDDASDENHVKSDDAKAASNSSSEEEKTDSDFIAEKEVEADKYALATDDDAVQRHAFSDDDEPVAKNLKRYSDVDKDDDFSDDEKPKAKAKKAEKEASDSGSEEEQPKQSVTKTKAQPESESGSDSSSGSHDGDDDGSDDKSDKTSEVSREVGANAPDPCDPAHEDERANSTYVLNLENDHDLKKDKESASDFGSCDVSGSVDNGGDSNCSCDGGSGSGSRNSEESSEQECEEGGYDAPVEQKSDETNFDVAEKNEGDQNGNPKLQRAQTKDDVHNYVKQIRKRLSLQQEDEEKSAPKVESKGADADVSEDELETGYGRNSISFPYDNRPEKTARESSDDEWIDNRIGAADKKPASAAAAKPNPKLKKISTNPKRPPPKKKTVHAESSSSSYSSADLIMKSGCIGNLLPAPKHKKKPGAKPKKRSVDDSSSDSSIDYQGTGFKRNSIAFPSPGDAEDDIKFENNGSEETHKDQTKSHEKKLLPAHKNKRLPGLNPNKKKGFDDSSSPRETSREDMPVVQDITLSRRESKLLLKAPVGKRKPNAKPTKKRVHEPNSSSSSDSSSSSSSSETEDERNTTEYTRNSIVFPGSTIDAADELTDEEVRKAVMRESLSALDMKPSRSSFKKAVSEVSAGENNFASNGQRLSRVTFHADISYKESSDSDASYKRNSIIILPVPGQRESVAAGSLSLVKQDVKELERAATKHDVHKYVEKIRIRLSLKESSTTADSPVQVKQEVKQIKFEGELVDGCNNEVPSWLTKEGTDYIFVAEKSDNIYQYGGKDDGETDSMTSREDDEGPINIVPKT